MRAEAFTIHVADAVLDDLRARLAAARLPEPDPPDQPDQPDPDDAGADARAQATDWDAGTPPRYLHALAEHWRTRFDWRAIEHAINRGSHFRAEVGGLRIHFIHERGVGPDPLPLVLTHGYPDSFLRFAKLIPLLVDPAAHGADPDDAFDVVVPSLPGYGFSDPPAKDAATFHVGDLWHELMTRVLGYDRFGAHGGDWGSTVSEHLARSHSDAVIGIHLTDVPFWHAFQKPRHPSPAEVQFLADNERFMQTEGAYAMIQGTHPRVLAQGLNDSPIGLAAWIVEKFARWSDCDGDVERRFTKDELLANVMLYWVTHTIGSSFLPYYDYTQAGAMRWISEKAREWIGSSKVPTGFARFPKDLVPPPREWVERFHDVRRWTEMPRGGHFAAMEEPELLAADLRAFFRPLRE